jgi:hypothetical protein
VPSVVIPSVVVPSVIVPSVVMPSVVSPSVAAAIFNALSGLHAEISYTSKKKSLTLFLSLSHSLSLGSYAISPMFL